ncbi:MAG: beta-galactosidase [Victivallaceae bacterium]|nr:beta-galactosidase [Victivallaceae bacterium]
MKKILIPVLFWSLVAMAENPFSVRVIDGVPRWCKNGVPATPVFFWQHNLDDVDVNEAKKSGIEVFTCFNSKQSYEHPYWVGEGKYDFSWHDAEIGKFFSAHPDAYLIPRVFVPAPYWWLEKHPEEMIGFTDNPERTRGNGGGSTFHESFASEAWKKEQGEAVRQLVRHFKSMPWGERIIGIHITGGTLGEWHIWSGGKDPDCSVPMAKRYGKPIPGAMERDAEYFECFYSATVDAIDHFCRIVKEESDYLTVVFYGYFLANYTPYSHHKALNKLLELDSVDILSSPHVYARRAAGDDGYFRAFPATVAKHGKLFVNEADDRTELGKRDKWDGGWIRGRSEEESVNMLRREFGQAVAHCVGLWYMDIDPGIFRKPAYWAEIDRAYKWYTRQLALPQKRVSEIAVLCDDRGRIHMPREQFLNPVAECAVRKLTFGSLCHIGAPFDFYTLDAADFKTLEKYKVIVLLDGVSLSEKCRAELKKLQNSGRAFIWLHGSGAYDAAAKKWDTGKMRDLTGMDFSLTEKQTIPWQVMESAQETKPGFSPLESHRDFGDWSSHYFGGFAVSPAKFRAVCKEANVFLYSEEDDVVSASESALMIHASSDGVKTVKLPSPKKVTDMVSGEVLGEKTTVIRKEMNFGETALFELAPAP